MNVPSPLRKQFAVYAAAGFHAVEIKPAKGSHFKVIFAEFATPQIVTTHASPNALKHNLSRFRNRADAAQEKLRTA